jgi:hypothetical protein
MSMIALSVAVGCALWGGAAVWEGAVAPSLEDLSFLEGAWEGEHEGTFMREVWDPARGDAMVGHFMIVQDGHAGLYELFTVERQEDGGLVLRLRHFGWGLEPWASEASGPLSMPLREAAEGRAVFEDPERDFPRRVVYSVEGERLTVRLEPGEGSEREEIVTVFEKVD